MLLSAGKPADRVGTLVQPNKAHNVKVFQSLFTSPTAHTLLSAKRAFFLNLHFL